MWDYSINGNLQQKKYGKFLVRKMIHDSKISYWVINLGAFAGMIELETPNIRKAIRYAKGKK
jgi:hypothetical protein